MDGLGAAMPPSTDVLGQLLSKYAKRVDNSQLQHLKILLSSTHILFNNIPSVCSFMGVLSAYPHLQHRFDVDIAETLSTEVAEDSSHVAKLRTALEAVDAKKRKDIMSQSSMNTLDKSRKKAMLASLAELSERMPSLLDIDHPCAQRHIKEARHAFEVRSYFIAGGCSISGVSISHP
ncbi:hypothetical protein P3L10_004695 [Capsicum annuum]